MKTEKEIEKLADEVYPHTDMDKLKSHMGFINGYTQCQNDMLHDQTVTRFEVIDENGRVYVKNSLYNCHLELSYQDDGRTLKVFIKPNKQD